MEANNNYYQELEYLFELSKPEDLHKNISFLLHQYIIQTPPDLVRADANKFYQSIVFLLEFLEDVKNDKS